MTRRTIAIGDIHGCAQALSALIDVIAPTDDDVIVTLGDYIDRGPDSSGVVDLMIDLTERCEVVPLLGNHESMLIDSYESPACFEFWKRCGGLETLESYGGSMSGIPPSHLAFFRGCRLFYETESYFMVHANYDPILPLDEQPVRLLLWEHIVYRMPTRHESGKTAIVGHTPQDSGEILDLDHLIGIDTYCVGGRWLTALDVNTRQVWQANRDGELRVT
jgi:serine/threonine protein phosphatase 1